MFERFTTEARDAVIAAQEIARDAHATSIDSRHILLALLVEPNSPRIASALTAIGADPTALTADVRDHLTSDDLDAEALGAIGIDLDAVRRRADALFGEGALGRGPRREGHLPFTADAKKVLEVALREAIRLKSRSIDSRHILLGIIRSATDPGARLLTEALTRTTGHADLAALRGELDRP